jgi:hypothetical protein
MSATFEIKVTAIRTATVGSNTGVVKQVDWTMKGTEGAQSFELPQTTDLPDPDGQPFIPLEQLTEAKVVEWIEATDLRLESIKAHIQYVLDKELAKAQLTVTNMPWNPNPPPTNPTPP